MPREEPSWWYGSAGDVRVRLLRPLSSVVAAIAQRRMARPARYRAAIPVICVGNFTAGGTGKTPLSFLIAQRLKDRGLAPAFLTRGYGARRTGTAWVEPSNDTARDVGDEPLLLARAAPVLISPDREEGARLIAARQPPFDVIVMDDGLQNPALAKDLRIAVVDGRRGFGNGEVIPAGPLRARLDFQLHYADAIVINQPATAEEVSAGPVSWLRDHFPGPVLQARAMPAVDAAWLTESGWLAFAGIANPQRFYDLLRTLGGNLIEARSFPDHHPFSAADARALLSRADTLKAGLVTTEKDWVRLIGGTGACAELAKRAKTLPIRLSFDARDALRFDALLDGLIEVRPRHPLK